MGIFRALKSMASGRNTEFAKRLNSKRLELARCSLQAGLAPKGPAQYGFRAIGFDVFEAAVSPEATLVQLLEIYQARRSPSECLFSAEYGMPPIPTGKRDTPEIHAKRVRRHIVDIEYGMSGRSLSADNLPAAITMQDYLLAKLKSEHPLSQNIGPEFGYSAQFFDYAIEESAHVFRR